LLAVTLATPQVCYLAVPVDLCLYREVPRCCLRLSGRQHEKSQSAYGRCRAITGTLLHDHLASHSLAPDAWRHHDRCAGRICRLLRPFNFDTLATHVYQFASDELIGPAALGALMIVLVGLAPVILLTMSIDRSRELKAAGIAMTGQHRELPSGMKENHD